VKTCDGNKNNITTSSPQIPGLPLHPRQIEDRQRLSEIRRDDPTFAGGSQDAAKHMPARTRNMLISLSKLLKEAPKLLGSDPQKAATFLDKPPVKTQ
jgi:penicillin-binding protein 1A